MKLDLNEKINEHLIRLEDLARETEDDESQSFSSRAAALNSLSSMLRDLTKSQAEIVNMERMMKVEQVTIETVRKYLKPEQYEDFMADLESVLREELEH